VSVLEEEKPYDKRQCGICKFNTGICDAPVCFFSLNVGKYKYRDEYRCHCFQERKQNTGEKK
jgi:hypothetical protein